MKKNDWDYRDALQVLFECGCMFSKYVVYGICFVQLSWLMHSHRNMAANTLYLYYMIYTLILDKVVAIYMIYKYSW